MSRRRREVCAYAAAFVVPMVSVAFASQIARYSVGPIRPLLDLVGILAGQGVASILLVFLPRRRRP